MTIETLFQIAFVVTIIGGMIAYVRIQIELEIAMNAIESNKRLLEGLDNDKIIVSNDPRTL